MNLVDVVNKDHSNPRVEKYPQFRSGDTLAVSVRISEGEKSRIQVFEGMCIAVQARNSINGSFRVRKVSNGVGVERIFPFHSPVLEAIKVVQRGKSRQSKLYYLRDRSGKSARIGIDYERK